MQLTFSTVTVPGTTSVTSGTEPPGPAPSGFSLGYPAIYYDVATSAQFTGNIEVCFSYTGVTFRVGEEPRLVHYENGQPVDLPTTVNTAREIVCGTTLSLSPFSLASVPMQTVGIDVKPGAGRTRSIWGRAATRRSPSSALRVSTPGGWTVSP